MCSVVSLSLAIGLVQDAVEWRDVLSPSLTRMAWEWTDDVVGGVGGGANLHDTGEATTEWP